MSRVWLFVVSCGLGGLGGALGSILGHALGPRALWIGGVAGGLLAALLGARVAVWRRWIAPRQYWPTAGGTAAGFLLAALVAVNTLSSPVGPILSTALVGMGALLGSRGGRHEPDAGAPVG
jgi:peptidoglycan/LPS O-acetylase OafA/YrhL